MKKQLHTYIFFIILFLSTCNFIFTHTNIYGSESATTETATVQNNSPVSDTENTPVPSISLKKVNYSMYPGQKITPKIIKNNGFDGHIIYSSGNRKVATFSKGVITAKTKGKSTLTAKTGDNTIIKIIVRVNKPIKKIDIPQNSLQINKNDKRTITVNIIRNGSTEPIQWSSSNKKIVTVNKNGKITAKKNGTAYIYCKSKYSGKSDRIKIRVQKTKYIAFTFDDGPGPYTNDLLNTLQQYNSKATFFVVGNRVDLYSDMVIKAYNNGNEIGSHSYDHAQLTTLSKSEIRNELKTTRNLIKKYIGAIPSVTRPPYGSYNSNVLTLSRTPVILWSVDTLDWKYRDANYVKNTILSTAADGEIVLLHDIHSTSVEGFKLAIKQLKKQGYELVTVSELFELKGQKFEKGKVYFNCR